MTFGWKGIEQKSKMHRIWEDLFINTINMLKMLILYTFHNAMLPDALLPLNLLP